VFLPAIPVRQKIPLILVST